MPNWGWAEGTNRYRNLDTGRFVSAAQVRGWGAEAIDAGGLATNGFAEMVVDGRLNVRDWTLLMRDEIKDEYIQQYILGRGGLERMTQADWGSIGGSLKEQFVYLRRFSQQIASGELTVGQIQHRSRMYVNSAREAYSRAQGRVAQGAGLREVRWVVQFEAEHCKSCLAFEALGWQKIADDPYHGATCGSGATECLTACRCHLEFR